MPTWKVLIIGFFFLATLALGMATIVIPLGLQGGERWAWLGGLLAVTAVVGTLFTVFLRYAEKNMDAKASRVRY